MGSTEKDVKPEEVVDKVEADAKEVKAADKKTEAKPAKPATAAKPADKKTEDKKSEDKKSEDKKDEIKKPEEKQSEEKKAEDVTPAEPQEAKPEEVKSEPESGKNTDSDEAEPSYPYDVILKKSISTYRGPSIELLNKPFGGKLTVLGITGNFYKVQFVRAGFGTVVAYVLCEEVRRWAS